MFSSLLARISEQCSASNFRLNQNNKSINLTINKFVYVNFARFLSIDFSATPPCEEVETGKILCDWQV